MNWKEFWNNKAGGVAYEQVGRVIRGKEMPAELMHQIAQDIANQLYLSKDDILLDVCCGNGIMDELLAPFCKRIYGVDFSEDLIAGAHNRQIAGAEFHCGNAANFKADHSFDKILLYFSFQYFESYNLGKKVIQNLVMHAKPGALIFIGDIPDKRKWFEYYNSPRKWIQFMRQSLTGKNDMGKFWHPGELINIADELSVECEIIEQKHWQPYSHYRFDCLLKVPEQRPRFL